MAGTALITGLAGQDGSYLGQALLRRGYEVHGIVRSKALDAARLPGDLAPAATLWQADIRSSPAVTEVLQKVRPDEVYHFAADSFVHDTVDRLIETAETNGIGVMRLLEAVRQTVPRARVYLAGSSEMFGEAPACPQGEETPFRPRNPYGIAKLAAYWAGRYYRVHHGLHVSNGITYNHESPRRPPRYVTRKVCQAAAAIGKGLPHRLTLGPLASRRDWGYAPDYVEAMWRMLQRPEGGDYVLGTGVTHSVGDLVEAAFREAGVQQWRDHVHIDPRLGSPETHLELRADPRKAEADLGWKATVGFGELVRLMVRSEMAGHEVLPGRTAR